MQIPKRIILLAKDKALSSFSVLAEQTVVEADTQATRAMLGATPLELQKLNALRGFLRGDGRTLRTRMDRHFAGLLDRALLTMHVDLRTKSNSEIDYNSLTLIDDDVVVRQIEVDRLVARLRDAEPVALGRVNLTIAIVHNDQEARERENPFRPYLLARSLHEALRELLWDEPQSRSLFEALGQAMVQRLPGFYSGILEVFESGGVTARLAARPGAMSRAERDRLAWQSAARLLLAHANVGMRALPELPSTLREPPSTQLGRTASATAAGGFEGGIEESDLAVLERRLLPKLERLRGLAGTASGAASARGQDLIDIVWNIFNQPRGTRVEREYEAAKFGEERSELDTVLFSLQQDIAAGIAAPEPLALRELLGAAPAHAQQTRIIEVVSLQFETIVHDDLLGEAMQLHLRRLFVPVVRAALMDPDLLHDARHPARRLIERLGSVAAGIAPEHAIHAALEIELTSIVGAVLDLFDDDMHIFTDAGNALDSCVSALLAKEDPRIGPCMEAVAEAAASSGRLAAASAALSASLQPLHVDPRLADFILGTWARVLSHPGAEQQGIALLPELLWSAQAKATPEDRAAMMRMLPEVVRKVREGMAEIALPEAPSKAAFDRLVAVHMDVLANRQAVSRRAMTLEQFRDHFKDFTIADQTAALGDDEWIGKFELEAGFGRRAIDVTLHARSAARLIQASDEDWLSWAHPGTPFEIRVDERYQPALLCAASPGRPAYLFSVSGQAAPSLYLKGPLLEALENSSVRPLEHASVFDRGVQSLLAGADALSMA